MALIDLGELAPATAEPAAGPRPKGVRSLRTWSRWPALLAWLPAVLLTAAAPPIEAPFVGLADTAYEGWHYIAAFSGDAVVLSDRRSVTVYRHDGRVGWRSPVPQDSGISVHGESLIVRVFGSAPRTEAYELASGRRLWSLAGSAEPFGDVVVADVPAEQELAAYDLSGQTLRWRATGVIAHALDHAGGGILVLDREGGFTERDPRTGAVIRAAQVSVPRSHINMVLPEAQAITLYHRGIDVPNGRHTVVDRHDFTVTGGGPGPVMQAPIGYGCGQVRCEVDPVRRRSRVLDAGTGQQLWQAEGWYGLMGTAAGILGYPLFNDARSRGPVWLAAARTGERLSTIEAWYPIREDEEVRVVKAPVLLSFVHTDSVNGRTLLAGFDSGGMKVLGSVPHVMSQCKYEGGRLACLTGDHRLLVLEVHPRWR